MPTNKHANIRYHALDRCFRNGRRRFYMADLIEACQLALLEHTGINQSVSRRQIYYDIDYMESDAGWSAEIIKHRDGRKVYFRYADEDFSIHRQVLSDEEKSVMRETLSALTSLRGTTGFEGLDKLRERLSEELDLPLDERTIIELQQNEFLRGRFHFNPIYSAISDKYPLSITYRSFKRPEPSTFDFHPYLLKQYNNRWFVLGRSDGYDSMTTLALDRIEGLDSSSVEYRPYEGDDLSEYFDDVVGVTIPDGEEPQHLKLKVSPSLLPYIETKPIHGSQRSFTDEQGERGITLDIIPNYELEALLLGFGEGIEILEPLALRRRFQERISAMKALYADD